MSGSGGGPLPLPIKDKDDPMVLCMEDIQEIADKKLPRIIRGKLRVVA
jgi:hypothetical protein